MEITVAVPSYNKEKFIRRCIDSVLVEKDQIDTILLVDNNSSDQTFAIAKTYEPVIACIKNNTNLGMAGNWNKCIDLCETEWLLILHADDEMVPGAVQKYKDFIKKYPSVGIVHANSYSVIEGVESTKSYTENPQKEFWHAGTEGVKCHYGVCSTVMVKKEVYNKLGNFIESISSDAEMWSRIANKYDVGFMNTPTAVYHVSKTSLGFESLTKRSLHAIKKDWDYLNLSIANNYPTEDSRRVRLQEYYDSCPGSYYTVAKANIKVHNYIKAFQACLFIIFYYNGLILLIKLIFSDIKKYTIS